MPNKTFAITKQQSDTLDRLVASGRFADESEAMRAGLRLLEEDEARAIELRQRLLEGLAQAKSGDLAQGSGEEAIRRAFSANR